MTSVCDISRFLLYNWSLAPLCPLAIVTKVFRHSLTLHIRVLGDSLNKPVQLYSMTGQNLNIFVQFILIFLAEGGQDAKLDSVPPFNKALRVLL